jgi:hypothetical protein
MLEPCFWLGLLSGLEWRWGLPPAPFGASLLGEGGWSRSRAWSRGGLGFPDGGDLLYGGGIQAQVFVGDVLLDLLGAGGSDDGA